MRPHRSCICVEDILRRSEKACNPVVVGYFVWHIVLLREFSSGDGGNVFYAVLSSPLSIIQSARTTILRSGWLRSSFILRLLPQFNFASVVNDG